MGRKTKEGEGIQPGDLIAPLDLVIDSVMKTGGYPATYPNTPEGLNAFVENTLDYFEYVRTRNETDEGEGLILDIEGWTTFLGISRTTLFNYTRRGGKWAEVIDFYKNCILSVKKNLALRYRIPPVLFIFDSVNNNGYASVNKLEVSQAEPDANNEVNFNQRLETEGLIWDADTQAYKPRKPLLLEVVEDIEGDGLKDG